MKITRALKLFCLAIALFAGASAPAFASTTFIDTITGASGSGVADFSGSQWLGNTFNVPAQKQIDKIEAMFYSGSMGNAGVVNVKLFNAQGAIVRDFGAQTIPRSDVGQIWTYTPAQGVVVPAGDYFIGFQYVSGSLGIRISSVNITGQWKHYSGSGAIDTGSGADLRIKIYGDNYQTPASIAINYPLTLNSYNSDFSHFKITYTIPAGGTFAPFIEIGTTAENMVEDTVEPLIWITYAPNDSAITKYILKNTPLWGNYYARAYVKNLAGDRIAQSDIVQFGTVGSTTRYTGSAIDSTTAPNSTSTDQVITCDETDGLFANSLCNLGVYLFQPEAGAFDNYKGLWETISKKPPFGYFTAIQGSFNSLNASTSAYTIEDTTAINGSIFTPLKNGVAFLLWFAFGMWIFNRFRHITL
jgi:hypothetical protein